MGNGIPVFQVRQGRLRETQGALSSADPPTRAVKKWMNRTSGYVVPWIWWGVSTSGETIILSHFRGDRFCGHTLSVNRSDISALFPHILCRSCKPQLLQEFLSSEGFFQTLTCGDFLLPNPGDEGSCLRGKRGSSASVTMSGLRGDQASLRFASGCGRAVPPTSQLTEEGAGHRPVGSGRLKERQLACGEEVGAPRRETRPGDAAWDE